MRRTPTAPLLAVLAGLALAAPTRALPPEEEATPAGPLLEQPAYDYPDEAFEPEPYPSWPWRAPAAAVDLLLVRPLLTAGLAGGAVLFVGTLPLTAPTRTTDDAFDALAGQARATFARPLGQF
jgi:hypothetical protein